MLHACFNIHNACVQVRRFLLFLSQGETVKNSLLLTEIFYLFLAV